MKLHNKEVIIDLLIHKDHLRDNDQALIANIWWRELTTMGKDKANAFEFLKIFSEGGQGRRYRKNNLNYVVIVIMQDIRKKKDSDRKKSIKLFVIFVKTNYYENRTN